MRKVAGLENELDVAKSTLYRYIDTDEMRQYVSIRDNLKYISDEGYELLVKKFGTINQVANETKNSSQELQRLSHETELRQLRIESLEREIQSKNEHIESLKGENRKLHELLQQEKQSANYLAELVKNSQILLCQEKEKMLLLEASNKKSWWSKLRKKINH